MNDSRLLPPQQDIDAALAVEKNEAKTDWELYLDCMNGVPMSVRTSPREKRDGCILTNNVFLPILRNRDEQ